MILVRAHPLIGVLRHRLSADLARLDVAGSDLCRHAPLGRARLAFPPDGARPALRGTDRDRDHRRQARRRRAPQEIHHLAGGLGMVCGCPAHGAGHLRGAGLSEHGLRRAEPHNGFDRIAAGHADDVRHTSRQPSGRTDAGRTRLAGLRPPAPGGTALAARASAIGILVVIWHVPLVVLGMLPGYALFATFAFTIVFGWLFNNTRGSVLMTLIAHAADGLVRTGNLGLNAIDSERHIMLLVATWCVAALVVVLSRVDAHAQAEPPRAHPLIVGSRATGAVRRAAPRAASGHGLRPEALPAWTATIASATSAQVRRRSTSPAPGLHPRRPDQGSDAVLVRGMHQDRQKHAAAGILPEPGEHDCGQHRVDRAVDCQVPTSRRSAPLSLDRVRRRF